MDEETRVETIIQYVCRIFTAYGNMQYLSWFAIFNETGWSWYFAKCKKDTRRFLQDLFHTQNWALRAPLPPIAASKGVEKVAYRYTVPWEGL